MNKIKIFLVLIIVASIIGVSCNTNQQPKNNTDTIVAKSTVEEYVFEKEITITGNLYELPYENAANTQMKTHILSLGKAIKVISNSKEYDSQDLVEEIQIGFNESIDPAKFLDKTITVKGVIYANQTIHDRRPVVMVDAQIINP